MAWIQDAAIVLIATEADRAMSYLTGIPTVPQVLSVTGDFNFSGIQQIVVDYRYETTVDTNGQTLIPPTLRDFAATFAKDVNATFGSEPVVGSGGRLASNGVFLTLG